MMGKITHKTLAFRLLAVICCTAALYPQDGIEISKGRINKGLVRKALNYVGSALGIELERTDELLENCIMTLESLTKLNDTPVYEMTWYGDFGFSTYIKTGCPPYEPQGTGTIRECSGITAANMKGEIIFGRNQDGGGTYIPPLILHTDSPDGYASVTMSFARTLDEFWEKPTPLNAADLLLTPYRSRDGVNEYGLTVSSAAADDSEHVYDPYKITLYHAEMSRLALEYAKTVEEAVQLFHEYNNWASWGIHHLFSDVYGNTVILEYYNDMIILTPKVEPWVVMTNFSIRNQPRGSLLDRCWRYETAYLALQACNGIVSLGEAMEIMRSISILYPATDTHPEYRTNWSAVYNQTRGEMAVCGRANYDVVHRRYCPMNIDFKNKRTQTRSSNIRAGKTIRITAILKNRSQRKSHTAGLEFYLSERKKIGDTSIFLGERSLPSFAPGREKTIRAHLTVPSDADPGSYFILSRIKLGDLNRDENKKNNISASADRVVVR